VIKLDVEDIKVYSFTETLDQGNPAGVVFDCDELTEKQMMTISKILEVSETAFLFPCDEADYFVRFFSPTSEVDLCGHATIAAFSVLGKNQEKRKKETISFTQKTKAGILKVHCIYDGFCLDSVMMEQQKPVIRPVDIDEIRIANALQIPADSLRKDLPRSRVSTGLFTLPVCIDSFEILKAMTPDIEKIYCLCKILDVGSIHVFTFDTIEDSSVYHARNFAPIYGVNEDPVTGTANGAVCSYLKYYGKMENNGFVCEQGDIIGRSGRVHVDLSKDMVWVGGKAAIDTSKIITV